MSDLQLTILDEIQARLENLTEANGYRYTVYPQTVVRAKLEPFKNGDLPAINYVTGTDTLIEKVFKHELRELPLVVEAYTKTRDDPFINISSTLGNDVIATLFRKTSAPLKSDPVDLKLGGLVDSLIVQAITPVIAQGQAPWCGVLLDCVIQYKVLVADFSTTI